MEQNIDILVTQEGRARNISKLVVALNEYEMEQSSGSPVKGIWSQVTVDLGFLCNSIITKHPIVSANAVIWDWNQSNDDSIGSRENRGAVIAAIKIPTPSTVNEQDSEQKLNHQIDPNDDDFGALNSKEAHESNVEEESKDNEQDENETVISIMGMHLDHVQEHCRMIQMNYFLENIIKSDNMENGQNHQFTKYPDFIIGDFNSLLQSDYDAKRWKEIAKIRKLNKWEKPTSELMEYLLSTEGDHKWRYHDALEMALKFKFYGEIYLPQMTEEEIEPVDFWTFNERVTMRERSIGSKKQRAGALRKLFSMKNKRSKGNKEKKEQQQQDYEWSERWNALFMEYFMEHWDYSSRFETRIDYILVSHAMLKESGWRLVDCGFVDTITNKVTDHNLFWCDFEKI